MNYNIPLKDADYIVNMGEWIERNDRENLIGAVFFNEPATSFRNKKAVYKVISMWYKKGFVR